MTELIRQHLIDPEICIRCHTCEEACPIGAITHDDVNVVVDAEKCNFCMSCIGPCPTGSIDNWRVVRAPYSLTEQLGWTELPPQQELGDGGGDSAAIAPRSSSGASDTICSVAGWRRSSTRRR